MRSDRRLQVLPVTSRARSVSWMAYGACRQANPELFFPVATATDPPARQAEAAKAVCAPCTVRANCLSYALESMPEGIWGGTTPEERSAVRKRPFPRQASAQSSGTVSAAVTGQGTHRAGDAAGQPGRTA